MELLSVIRRWALRDQLSIREIARRTGLSRNTIRKYLRGDVVEPAFKLPEGELQSLAHWLRSLNVSAFDTKPSGDVHAGEDFFFGNVASVFGTEEIFEQDAERKGKMLGGDALLIEGVEAEDFVFLGADFESGFAVETIHRHDGHPSRYDLGRVQAPRRRLQLHSVMRWG